MSIVVEVILDFESNVDAIGLTVLVLQYIFFVVLLYRNNMVYYGILQLMLHIHTVEWKYWTQML